MPGVINKDTVVPKTIEGRNVGWVSLEVLNDERFLFPRAICDTGLIHTSVSVHNC